MTIDIDLLDTESAQEAIVAVSEIAAANGVDWALVGGIAVALYGGDRNTKDIDVIANKLLPLDSEGKLRQGGERYSIKAAKRDVYVDWILRNDAFKKLFEIALSEAVKINGVPVVTPEWLVILKFIAGRFKDQEDAVFLLSQKGLVDRKSIKEKIIKHVGREAWGLARHGYERWYEMADGRTRENERNESEGYIDS
ncbi:MAG: hypothetical protein KBD94_02015 [Pyrinomonadaceae bacterium]|nr:hypothetical protein [Pyrinomonadaceae bacterium]